MLEFKIQKKSKLSQARLGMLKTDHGLVETPSLVPVATQGVVKTLTSEEVKETRSQILIANTFHLHLKPGEKIIDSAGGLHKFMNWPKPLMTDSGGFQVFSLGFGSDLKIGKIFKKEDEEKIGKGSQPKFVKITNDGVYFNSPLNGDKLFLGPKESIRIQEKIGADIIFAFDECPPPQASFDYVRKAVDLTHQWAKVCLETKKSSQALFGIVQGSRFESIRRYSAEFINYLDFDGFGIGGDFGPAKTTSEILKITLPYLKESKPRHLLGVGHLDDMEEVIKCGVDLFDCTVPTHYARHGVAFVGAGKSWKKLDLRQSAFLKDKKPLDDKCSCFTCRNYKRNYISHLLKAGEITPLKLLTFHNLYFFNSFVEKIRNKIKEGKI